MKKIRLILLIFLWIVTVLSAIQPYVGSQLASYLLCFTLLVLPLFFANGLVLGLLVYRKSSCRYFHGCITLLNFYLLSSSFNIPIKSGSSEDFPSVRLVSCNVENFLLDQKVLKETSFTVADYSPDIVCLQERPHTSLLSCDSIFNVFGYGYTAVNDREDEVLNLAVLSKWPLLNKKEFYFTDSYNKFIQVDIQYPAGMIRLFNVHLQTTGIAKDTDISILSQFCKNAQLRNLQADSLSAEIKRSPYPVIVCGDFNDTPHSYVYHKVSRQLLDCFKECGTGWGGTFQTIGNLFRIDYILCSSILCVKDYQLINNPWSDHRIQFGELQFTASQKK